MLTATEGGVAVLSRPAMRRGRRRSRAVLGAVLFVLGFTAVFVSYGAAFGGIGRHLTLHQRGLDQVLGVVTIVMGLAFAGAFSRFSLANRELRLHRLPAPGLAGAPLLGILFAIGWTPCIGPTLAAVQGLAFDSATAGRGALLVGGVLARAGDTVRAGRARRPPRDRCPCRRAPVRPGRCSPAGVLLVIVGVLEVTGTWNDAVLGCARSRPATPRRCEPGRDRAGDRQLTGPPPKT